MCLDKKPLEFLAWFHSIQLNCKKDKREPSVDCSQIVMSVLLSGYYVCVAFRVLSMLCVPFKLRVLLIPSVIMLVNFGIRLASGDVL